MAKHLEELSAQEIALVMAALERKPASRKKTIAVLMLLSLAFVLCVLMGTCVYQAKDYRDKYGFTSTEPVPAPLSWLDYLIKR
jgi:hypothetical protein